VPKFIFATTGRPVVHSSRPNTIFWQATAGVLVATFAAGCDAASPTPHDDDNGQDGDAGPTEPAVWRGTPGDQIGLYLATQPADGTVPAVLAIGHEAGSTACPDSGSADCTFYSSEASLVDPTASGEMAVGEARITALEGAHVASTQDLDGDGLGDWVGGLGAPIGAFAVSSYDFSTIASFQSGPPQTAWMYTAGLTQAADGAIQVAVWVDALQGTLEDDASGIYLFDPTFSGAQSVADATASVLVTSESPIYGVATSDVDGDGVEDLLAVVGGSGPACLGVAVYLAPIEARRAASEHDRCIAEAFGTASPLLSIADVDDDGASDLLATNTEGNGIVLMGPVSTLDSAANATVVVVAEDVIAALVTVGDTDGDGRQDIGIGTPYADIDGQSDRGKVYVVRNPQGTVALGESDVRLSGSDGGGRLGYAIAATGDINRDGLPDFAVSAPNEDHNAGAVYMVWGP
jgi:hypothetical protein